MKFVNVLKGHQECFSTGSDSAMIVWILSRIGLDFIKNLSGFSLEFVRLTTSLKIYFLMTTTLIESVPCHCQAVVKTKGGPTNY